MTAVNVHVQLLIISCQFYVPIVFYKMEVLCALLWHKLSLLQVTPLICSHCNSQHCSPTIATDNAALDELGCCHLGDERLRENLNVSKLEGNTHLWNCTFLISKIQQTEC